MFYIIPGASAPRNREKTETSTLWIDLHKYEHSNISDKIYSFSRYNQLKNTMDIFIGLFGLRANYAYSCYCNAFQHFIFKHLIKINLQNVKEFFEPLVESKPKCKFHNYVVHPFWDYHQTNIGTNMTIKEMQKTNACWKGFSSSSGNIGISSVCSGVESFYFVDLGLDTENFLSLLKNIQRTRMQEYNLTEPRLVIFICDDEESLLKISKYYSSIEKRFLYYNEGFFITESEEGPCGVPICYGFTYPGSSYYLLTERHYLAEKNREEYDNHYPEGKDLDQEKWVLKRYIADLPLKTFLHNLCLFLLYQVSEKLESFFSAVLKETEVTREDFLKIYKGNHLFREECIKRENLLRNAITFAEKASRNVFRKSQNIPSSIKSFSRGNFGKLTKKCAENSKKAKDFLSSTPDEIYREVR